MLNRVSDENTAVYKGEDRPVAPSGAAVHVATEAATRPRLVEDSPRSRSQYLALLESSGDATVYQTLEWLDVFLTAGATLRFVALGEDAMVPFVCKGSGPTRRAYSLPFDTYGGVVGTGGSVPVPFDTIIETLGIPSARVVDFAGRIETRGERENVTTHIVSLEGGYGQVTRTVHRRQPAPDPAGGRTGCEDWFDARRGRAARVPSPAPAHRRAQGRAGIPPGVFPPRLPPAGSIREWPVSTWPVTATTWWGATWCCAGARRRWTGCGCTTAPVQSCASPTP